MKNPRTINLVSPIKNFFLSTAGILLISTLSAMGIQAPSWPQDKSDLPVDPTITFGSLNNGLRYIIKNNNTPENRISLRLLVNAGSLMESETQQGLAHFLEHMAFKGSTHFPEDELVKYFQTIGMAFGNDLNAHTWLDETVYQIDLPDNNEKHLKNALQIFTDFSHSLTLEPKSINKERGVILAEKRQRDSIEYRTFRAYLRFMLPETIIPDRLPIGIESVITKAARPEFFSFYRKWYTPERITLVVVGSIKPHQIIPLIENYLGTLPVNKNPSEDPFLPPVNNAKPLSISFHPEKDAESTGVSIINVTDFPYTGDNIARVRDGLTLSLTGMMANRRLEIAKNKADAPFVQGNLTISHLLNKYTIASIDFDCYPAKWEETLTFSEQFLRELLQSGFKQNELQEAKANIMMAIKASLEQSPTRKSENLADQYLALTKLGKVITSPEQDSALTEKILPGISTEDCLKILQQYFPHNGRKIFVSGNLDLEYPETQILEVYNNSLDTKVTSKSTTIAQEFAYKSSNTEGFIESRKKIEDLDIEQVIFKNNVRLNLKKTDFDAQQINIAIRFGAGLLEYQKDKPYLDRISPDTFLIGGLGKHSYDDIISLTAGKLINVNFDILPDSFLLSGKTNQEYLLEELELLQAYVTDPAYRPEGIRAAQKPIDQVYKKAISTPEGVFGDKVSKYLSCNDPRLGLPEKEILLSYTNDDIKNWLTKPLNSGYMEMTIVGDIDIEQTIKEVARTFGNLPDRLPSKFSYAEERQLKFPKLSPEQAFTVESDLQKAIFGIFWPTDDIWNISQTRKLNILTSILGDRLRIQLRNQMGQIYTPMCDNSPSDTFKNYGYLAIQSFCAPDQTDALIEASLAIVKEVYDKGVTEDEFMRAINPVRSALKLSERNNAYWLNTVIMSSQEQPQRLDWARSRSQEFNNMTVADINAVAKKFLNNEKAIIIKVEPTTQITTNTDHLAHNIP